MVLEVCEGDGGAEYDEWVGIEEGVSEGAFDGGVVDAELS